KFLNFLDIPHSDAKIVSPMDVHVQHEVPIFQFNNRVTTLEKEVAELKENDPLKTQATALVDKHLDAGLGETRDEFMNFLSALITARITEQAAASLTEFELTKILIDKMDKSESYLAAPEHRECYEGLKKSYDLDKTFFSTYGKVYSLKRSRKDKDKDEDPFAGSDRGLKKRKTSKDAEPVKEFEVTDSDVPHDQEENLVMMINPRKRLHLNMTGSPNLHNLKNLLILIRILARLHTKDKIKETLLRPAFRLLKSTYSIYAELEYDFKECYKALSEKHDWENPKGGDYLFDLTKPLPLVKIGNRQKRILEVTRVDVMKKHGYGYLQEIIVRRANNELYRFKEGDFPRLRINDIENMLLLIAHNWLINLSDDGVLDFAIALRMFTRSLVIQKRVKDLQLEVESYQKKSTSPSQKLPNQEKRPIYSISRPSRIHLCQRRFRTSLGDITKNIQIEYLPKRIWSTLEKKRANIMIKAIDKQLKERRMMRILEKFIGGRDYGTYLWLLQRTI
nr:hypothetical protein [Tanacetum cinerariifolium]